MALSVSHRMGSQIPVSGASRCCWSSGGRRYPSDLWIRRVRSGRDECAERACAPHRYDSALPIGRQAKLAISDVMGRVKGQTAIKTFKQFRNLRQTPYWGNHFWSPGYCVDTIGLDSEMIQKYVRYQEQKEHQIEQLQLGI